MSSESDIPFLPLLPGFFQVIAMGPDAVQLRSAGRVLRLAGKGVGETAPAVLAGMDGRTTLNELADRFDISRPVLEGLVRGLFTDGVIQDASWVCDGDQAGSGILNEFVAEQGYSPRQVAALISDSRVLLVGLDPSARIATAHLAAAGVGELILLDDGHVTAIDETILPSPAVCSDRRTDVAMAEVELWRRRTNRSPTKATVAPSLSAALETGADLVIGQVDASGERVHELNSLCLGAGVPFLLHEVTTLEAIVGPAVTPYRSACYQCMLSRRLSHLRYYDEDLAYRDALRTGSLRARAPAILSGCAALVGGMLSLEALALLSRSGGSRTAGAVLIVDFRSLAVEREEVLQLPDCPACATEHLQPTR